MTKTGVVAALPAEAIALAGRRCKAGDLLDLQDALLTCCGTGPERARAAAARLIEHGATSLVSWGTAGGTGI